MFALAVALVALVAFITIGFGLKKKWKATLILITALLAINWWCECVPFRLSLLHEKDNAYRLSVMNFNIDGSMNKISVKAEGLVNIINSYNPDIVFVIEFSELYPGALDSLLKRNYPYTIYKNHIYNSHYFYSKYPILSHKKLSQEGERHSFFNGVFHVNGSLISIYGCHFPSNNYTEAREYVTPDSIRNGAGLISYLKNINLAYRQRESETNFIKNYIFKEKNCCGDGRFK